MGALAGAGAVCLVVGAPQLARPTLASWKNSEFAKMTLTAKTVNPPTALACTTTGLILGKAKFSWTEPAAGGMTRTGYTWTLGGASTDSGTLMPDATTVTVGVSLLTLGTSTFTLRAKGSTASGWTSTAVTGRVRALTAAAVDCLVP